MAKIPHFEGFSGFVALVRDLRSPAGGCPWDLAQTHETLVPYVVEEAYEVVDAIRQADDEKLKEELGDLLLQVVLHAQLAADRGKFDVGAVVQGIIEKMVRRHPHVFGENVVADASGVRVQWDALKRTERQQGGASSEWHAEHVAAVPKVFPALYRASQIQARAAKVGFDWPEARGAWEKVKEEIAEVDALGEEALAEQVAEGPTRQALAEELGDLLFSVVNVSRKLGFDAETLLRSANEKFLQRFAAMEQAAEQSGKSMEASDLATLDKLWEEVKNR